MHIKAKTRLITIWLMLSLALLCALSITLIYAAGNQAEQTANVSVSYDPSENYLSKLTLKGFDENGDYTSKPIYYEARLDDSSTGEIIIPKTYTYNGYTAPVTRLRGTTSMDNDKITKVIIPDSITSIESNLFQNCGNLTSVTIGNGVTSIEEYTFCNCPNLTSVTIGNGVKTIERNAFYGCKRLTSVTIPDSVTSVGYGAFSDCTGLTSVTIGDGVTTIGEHAFDSCASLTDLTIGNNVSNIQRWAFEGCTSLTKLTIPVNLTIIKIAAFSNCPLEEVIFEITEGWRYWNEGLNIKNSVLSSKLEDPIEAAELFVTHSDCEWDRS